MANFGFVNIQAATSNFFDRAKVMAAVDKAFIRNMARSGALVRKIMRQSMRKRKKSAETGKPPSAHGNPKLKDLIFFAYDSSDKSTVIGPVLFAKGEAPELLEKGGTIVRKGRGGKSRAMHYRGNAFAAPALETAAPKLPAIWANSVKP